MDLCNLSVIKGLMADAGITFRKEFGQNFLTNRIIPENIAENCTDKSDSLIIEIGPGIGCLTAELASSYNRDIFAVPGRVTDGNSFGCNYLISKNVAAIYSTPATIPASLGWGEDHLPDSAMQPELFSYDEGNKEKILLSLNSLSPLQVEQICRRTGLDWDKVSILLLELELEGKIIVRNNTDYYLRK